MTVTDAIAPFMPWLDGVLVRDLLQGLMAALRAPADLGPIFWSSGLGGWKDRVKGDETLLLADRPLVVAPCLPDRV